MEVRFVLLYPCDQKGSPYLTRKNAVGGGKNRDEVQRTADLRGKHLGMEA